MTIYNFIQVTKIVADFERKFAALDQEIADLKKKLNEKPAREIKKAEPKPKADPKVKAE